MVRNVQKIDKFHASAQGKFTFAAAQLAIAVAVGLLAVDSGEIWQYIVAILMFVGGVRNLANGIRHQR